MRVDGFKGLLCIRLIESRLFAYSRQYLKTNAQPHRPGWGTLSMLPLGMTYIKFFAFFYYGFLLEVSVKKTCFQYFSQNGMTISWKRHLLPLNTLEIRKNLARNFYLWHEIYHDPRSPRPRFYDSRFGANSYSLLEMANCFIFFIKSSFLQTFSYLI